MIAFTQTDLPEPVVPAISRCGMAVRSATTGVPSTLCPMPMRSLESIRAYSGLSMMSRRPTRAVSSWALDCRRNPCRARRFDADRARGQGQGQVVGQAGDGLHLDAGALAAAPFHVVRLHAELGDGRAGIDLDDLAGRAEAGQRVLDDPRALQEQVVVDVLFGRGIEDAHEVGLAPGRGLGRLRDGHLLVQLGVDRIGRRPGGRGFRRDRPGRGPGLGGAGSAMRMGGAGSEAEGGGRVTGGGEVLPGAIGPALGLAGAERVRASSSSSSSSSSPAISIAGSSSSALSASSSVSYTGSS